MRSKSFYLTTTVIVFVSIISCVGTSPQIERSEIEYSKPQTATDLIEGEKVEYQLWFDKNKWKVLDHGDPIFKSIEASARDKHGYIPHALANGFMIATPEETNCSLFYR